MTRPNQLVVPSLFFWSFFCPGRPCLAWEPGRPCLALLERDASCPLFSALWPNWLASTSTLWWLVTMTIWMFSKMKIMTGMIKIWVHPMMKMIWGHDLRDEEDADLREIPSQHLLAASALSDKGSFADQHPSIYFAHHHHPHHRRRHQLRHHYHRRRRYYGHASELVFGQVSTSILHCCYAPLWACNWNIQFNTTKSYRLGCSMWAKLGHSSQKHAPGTKFWW